MQLCTGCKLGSLYIDGLYIDGLYCAVVCRLYEYIYKLQVEVGKCIQ
jgi:hypothetical protein